MNSSAKPDHRVKLSACQYALMACFNSIRWPDILQKDALPKDTLPKDILPNRHFADGHLLDLGDV
jgi:hypothetical protein